MTSILSLLKSKKSYFLFLIIIIAIASYSCFFTSTLWHTKTESEMVYTELFETIESDSMNVTINRWVYSEEQHLMEVELEIIKDLYTSNFTISARLEDGSKMPVETVLDEDYLMILHISDVPKDFKEIALQFHQEDKTGAFIVLYTNIYRIEKTEIIQKKTTIEYMRSRIELKIDSCQNKIQTIKETIIEKMKHIQTLEDGISSKTNSKRYLTADEIEKVDEEIENLETQISDTKEEITELKQEIFEIENTISNLSDQLSDFK